MYNNISASMVLYNTNTQEILNILYLIEKSIIGKTIIIDNSKMPCINIKEPKKKFEYIHNESNLGYGGGHNLAIKKILDTSTYHFVLNSDLYFNPDDLRILINYMENNPDVGQLMPKVIYPDGQLQYLCKLLPTPYDLIARRFIPIKKIREMNDEKYELRFTGYNKIMNVPYLSGCFMLLRVSALKEIGLFDERYFMYPEDIDLTRRIHKKYKTIFYPEVIIVHDHAKASYKNTKMMYVHIKNIIKYFNKWGWFFDKERREFNRRCMHEIEIGK